VMILWSGKETVGHFTQAASKDRLTWEAANWRGPNFDHQRSW
jgi:hypothetical protein